MNQPDKKRNPGGFDYRNYLKQQKIYAIMRCKKPSDIQIVNHKNGLWIMQNIMMPARRGIARHFAVYYKGETKNLLSALILGDRTNLGDDIRENYAKSGIIHTLAVSGLHVGFVTMIVMTGLGFLRFPKNIMLILTILVLLIYMAITQFKPPVVRATIMATVYLVGHILNRKPQIYNTLGIAAFVILLLDPIKLFDIGFQLSFSAILSIIFFYQQMDTMNWVHRLKQVSNNPVYRWTLSGLLVSFAAQIGTLPIIAFYFYRIPILSLILNLIAIPLTGIIVCLGFIGLMTSIASPWIAMSFTTLTDTLLHLMMTGTHWIAQIPICEIQIAKPTLIQIAIYLCFSMICITTLSNKIKKGFVWLLVIALNIHIWQSVYINRTPVIRWIQFDVGQGDAALLHLPRGKTMLIDGGDQTQWFDAGKRVIAPYLKQQGIRKIDGIIMSHPHHDHMGGLIYLMNHFNIQEFIWAGTPFSTTLNRKLQADLKKKKISCRITTAGDSLTHFPGISIQMLWPDSLQKQKANRPHFDLNNQSLVFQLAFGETSILFTGDAELSAERQYIKHLKHQTNRLLKVAHHGSITSSSKTLISRYAPDFAVISVGKNNRFNHPSRGILNRFKEYHIGLHRTDFQGAAMIDITSKTYKLRSLDY